MFNLIQVKRTGQYLWVSMCGVWNPIMCQWIATVSTKGQFPDYEVGADNTAIQSGRATNTDTPSL